MKVSDQHLRSMIESQQGLVVFSLDRDYRYTFYSASHFQTIESIWGEKISLGKSMLDVIKNPADRAKAKANFDRALQGESFVLEEEYGDRQLERNFYENRYNPIKDSMGNVTGLSVFVIDITRIKKVETARQEIESAYQVLFENTTDAIFIMKADGDDIGNIVSANSAAASMHGYTEEEFLKLNVKDLDAPEDALLFSDRTKRILNGEKISFEITHKKKDGSLFQLEVSAGLMEVGGRKYIMAIDRDITERKEREHELQESEQFIKKITESSPDFIYVMDLTRNKVIFRNRHIGESLGYSEEEIRAMHGDFFSFVGHPEDVAKMHMLLSRWEGVEDNVILENEFRLKHKDGEWRWFLTRDTVFKRDNQGKAIEVIGTVRDRTDKKKSELALQQSLSLLNASLESTEDGILVVDKSKKITAFNKKFLSLWRIPSGMAESKDDDALLTHVTDQLADPQKFLLRVNELYQNWSIETHEFIDFKDGRVFERYSKPQMIGDEVVGRVWSFRDVTERMQHEKNLRESEERFKRLQEASFGGIGIHDQGRILDANQGLVDITGYSLKELIGMDGLQLVAPEYREHVLHKIRTGYEAPYDVIGIKKGGARYHLEIHGKNISLNNKELRVTEFRDITERKMIEEEMREQNIRLTDIADSLTRKNEQLEEFTQIVSHNLRAPVGNIVTLLSLYDVDGSPNERSEYIQHLRGSSSLLLSTLNELNEVLKIKQSKNIEKQDLAFQQVFERVQQMLSASILEIGAELHADFSQAPSVLYPHIYLESIFLNLFSNALKYHYPGRTPVIRLTTSRLGQRIQLNVADNGLGIDLKKYGHQIFKMRKTFHNHPESRGLGLFLIKNQIESMGGEISVQSEVNIGTTFRVIMPS